MVTVIKMYVSNDYNYEDYEEDPKNGMKEFTEDLDEKHTSTNKNEKKTQNLIKIQITVLIIFIILLLIIGIFIGYTFFVSKTTPTTPTTLTTLTTSTTPITPSTPPITPSTPSLPSTPTIPTTPASKATPATPTTPSTPGKQNYYSRIWLFSQMNPSPSNLSHCRSRLWEAPKITMNTDDEFTRIPK